MMSGRFEFGIGAGYLRSEYDQAGIYYDTASVRVSRLEETRQKVEWIRQAAGENVLAIPHCLIGTLDQITEEVQRLREYYGISYIAVFDEHREAFAPVIARLAGTQCVMATSNGGIDK